MRKFNFPRNFSTRGKAIPFTAMFSVRHFSYRHLFGLTFDNRPELYAIRERQP
jgi:hypothetical protein